MEYNGPHYVKMYLEIYNKPTISSTDILSQMRDVLPEDNFKRVATNYGIMEEHFLISLFNSIGVCSNYPQTLKIAILPRLNLNVTLKTDFCVGDEAVFEIKSFLSKKERPVTKTHFAQLALYGLLGGFQNWYLVEYRVDRILVFKYRLEWFSSFIAQIQKAETLDTIREIISEMWHLVGNEGPFFTIFLTNNNRFIRLKNGILEEDMLLSCIREEWPFFLNSFDQKYQAMINNHKKITKAIFDINNEIQHTQNKFTVPTTGSINIEKLKKSKINRSYF